MRGGTASKIRTGVALAVALAGAAVARAQPPTVSIEDVWVVERNSASVKVTLSSYPGSPVTVGWRTVDGSAIAGLDYVADWGTVTFSDATPQIVNVSIIGDVAVEWNPSLPMDEAFFIELDPPTPTNVATLLKGRGTVTIIDDDRAAGVLPGLQFVSAVADSPTPPPTSGRVRLQWRVPPGSTTSGPVTDVLVRWNAGPGCVAPTSDTSPASGEFHAVPILPSLTQVVEHAPLLPGRYCYSLFAMYSGGPTTEPAKVAATPLDPATPSGAAVAWTYSVAGDSPSVEPPTVGLDAVYTVSNDGVVHAMTRGANGGTWPKAPLALEDWNPVGLGHVTSNRSPVVPLPYDPRLFVGTQSGEVHAVNGLDGAIAWSRSQPFTNTQLPNMPGAGQGTPAGLFTGFGGLNDEILVGSNVGPSSNTFFMLDPVTGAIVRTFTHPLMGGMLGMPAVDYAGNKVFFLTNSSVGTLFGLDLDPAKWPALPLLAGFPVALGVGANGSPVVRNGRLYFGAGSDVVLYRVSDGLRRSLNLSDGEIKGFVFPDRRNTNIYFSTTGTASTKGTVWGFKDTLDSEPPPFTFLWSFNSLTSPSIMSPSIVLHWPGTNFIYVGAGDGKLWQIELDPATWSPKLPLKSVQLEPPGTQIGAPSLDGPNNLVIVGSTSGVIYAVRTDPLAGIP
jgi:Calx-beta domain-containing protein/putative pyrroloquinoline-quinone binding quinoprotein